ncbi:gp16 family protein [Vulcaniibacterium tengchongense]|nr:regulatory protein GemA [Vulcaniibacterium tengchongense]
MDDDTYRALLVRLTGKASSADMTAQERNAVLAEFARLGFKVTERQARRRVFAGRPKSIKDVPMLQKVEALLADAKRPWSYAHGTARRMFSVARVEWLNHDQLHRLVAALEIDARRKSVTRSPVCSSAT